MATKPNKVKKISILSLEKIMKETAKPTSEIKWKGLNIVIKHTLSLKEMLEFVDGVTKSCFAAETSEFLPEVKMFAVKCCVLELYANFSLPSNIERRYNLVYNTDVYEVVMQHINHEQFNEIMDAINDKIDNAAQANIEAVNMQMAEVYNQFNNLQAEINNMFAGINPEDLSKFFGAVSATNLVDSYIEQDKEKDLTEESENKDSE